jgi:hypothetical protein
MLGIACPAWAAYAQLAGVEHGDGDGPCLLCRDPGHFHGAAEALGKVYGEDLGGPFGGQPFVGVDKEVGARDPGGWGRTVFGEVVVELFTGQIDAIAVAACADIHIDRHDRNFVFGCR